MREGGIYVYTGSFPCEMHIEAKKIMRRLLDETEMIVKES
jgi:hypothetical protein